MKKINIIGGGVAGLAAGCYAQMNGFETTIFEANSYPGGCCTAWERNGYEINGCVQWLLGALPNSQYHLIWQELGTLKGKEIVKYPSFLTVENADGKGTDVIFYTDIDRLETHLLNISPQDVGRIQELCEAVRAFAKEELPFYKPMELYSFMDGISNALGMFGFLRRFMKWNRQTIYEYAGGFKHPALQTAFAQFWNPNMSALIIPMCLAWCTTQALAYPIGGSRPIAQSLANRFTALGGNIHYHSKVSKILTDAGMAKGIRLISGEEYDADYVLSAMDRYQTFFGLLGEKFISRKTAEQFRELPLFYPILFISIGVKKVFNTISPTASGINIPLKEVVDLGAGKLSRFAAMVYNHDPQLAPNNSTLITTALNSSFEFWREKLEKPESYGAEKARIIQIVIDSLEQRFPGLATEVEMTDAATPLTYHNYTGVHKGSFEGWLPSPAAFRQQFERNAPGLANFYHLGQWITPGGGLTASAKTGRDTIQLICHKEKTSFQVII